MTFDPETASLFSRRHFLATGVRGATALAFSRLMARAALAISANPDDPVSGSYGPLFPARTENTGETLLALPKGFRYTVIGRTGSPMSDGTPTPRAHDGMAAFKVGKELRLVRNHEISHTVPNRASALTGQCYDRTAGGGVTTLVIDPRTRTIMRDFVSLSGTLRNCAGGPTPWGSWISCEETVLGPQVLNDAQGNKIGGFDEKHGYCFEVAARADGCLQPQPLKAMGRFVHEAIAADRRTGIVYETEDHRSAGFYRFIPNRKKLLAAGGRLQMLAIKGAPRYDTRTAQKVGTKLPVTWVDIVEPDPAEAETDALAVYRQGHTQGAATFARLEGCWYGTGRIFFSATSGGDKQLGQIWEYAPDRNGDGNLTLIFESPSAQVLDYPDNLCVSPRGGLVICEDGQNEQYVRGLTRDGRIFDFARNIVAGFENREFAGATFSPNGETLFVNIQTPGLTFAIWGPWSDGTL